MNHVFESLQLSRKDQAYQLTDERSSPGPEILASRDPKKLSILFAGNAVWGGDS